MLAAEYKKLGQSEKANEMLKMAHGTMESR
jgi:hypothetical protein